MRKAGGEHGQYVRRVQEKTQHYSQTLLQENERLRASLAGAQVAQSTLETQLAAHTALGRKHRALQTRARRLTTERTRLRAEVEGTRFEVRQREALYEDLQRKLRAVEDDSQRFSRGYFDVERQNANLANLYVASYRLHGTLDHNEVVLAIQEILANLVGCEEVALFEREPGAQCLQLVRASGVEAGPLESVPVGHGVIGNAVLAGEIAIAPDWRVPRAPAEEHLSACVPVLLAGQVVGVIALFRLLAHKPALQDLDRELFDLLAHQAGTALYCTKLHAARVSATRPVSA